MAVFQTRWFSRWARKQGLSARALCAAVAEIQQGLYEADLGGGLVKKRVARPGQGKSGGFRTLIATNLGDRWIFVFGFPKNVRSNIDQTEEAALKLLSAKLLGLNAKDLRTAVEAGELLEVPCNEKE